MKFYRILCQVALISCLSICLFSVCENNSLLAADAYQKSTDFENPVEISAEVKKSAEYNPKADPPKNQDGSPKAVAGAPVEKGLFLTLDECVEIAILNNLGLKIGRLNDRSTDVNLRSAWAQYYPDFGVNFNHANGRHVGTNAGSGSNSLSGTVLQRTPWGTQLELLTSETRTGIDRSTAAGNMQLDVTQPLWKGRGTDVGMAGIRTARIKHLISRGSLDLQTQQLIFNVRSGYAEIIRQIEQRTVNIEGIRSAKTFLDLTVARYKAGQVTQLDVFNAEVQLHTNELTLVTTERLLETDYDALKQLLDVSLEEALRVDAPLIDFGEKAEPDLKKILESDEASGTVSLVIRKGEGADQKVVETKLLFQASHFDDIAIMRTALDSRLDLLNSRRNIAVQKINTLLAHDGLGYQVDLNGSFARTDTGRALFERDNGTEVNNWNYGLASDIPWGKIKDRAAYELALLELQKAQVELKQAWIQVQLDVRNIMRVLRVAEKSMLIEGRLVEQAKRAVDAARISFDRGLKDSFDVIIVENAYLQAKSDFINFKLSYVVDLAQLQVVVGKPTGRIDLGGQTVGGLIDASIPTELREHGLPTPAAEAEPSSKEDPFNDSREYRKDYNSSKNDPVFIEPDK